jgi:hypothetical protein
VSWSSGSADRAAASCFRSSSIARSIALKVPLQVSQLGKVVFVHVVLGRRVAPQPAQLG